MLDLGKWNRDCRFVMIRYTWSQADEDRYDQDGEPPCRHWHIDKRTPILSLNFLEFHYSYGGHAYVSRSSQHTQTKLMAERLPSLLICDLFPYSCIRLTHSRFIMTSDQLAESLTQRSEALLKDMKKEPLDQYHVDEDEVLETILILLSGSSQVRMGLCDTEIDTLKYRYQLGDVLQAGFEGFMRNKPIE